MRFNQFHRLLDDEADDTHPALVAMVTHTGSFNNDEMYRVMLQSAGMTGEKKCIAIGHLLKTICVEDELMEADALRIVQQIMRFGYGPETAQTSEAEMLKRLKQHRSEENQGGTDASQDPSTGRG